jgi:hypothetical protein
MGDLMFSWMCCFMTPYRAREARCSIQIILNIPMKLQFPQRNVVYSIWSWLWWISSYPECILLLIFFPYDRNEQLDASWYESTVGTQVVIMSHPVTVSAVPLVILIEILPHLELWNDCLFIQLKLLSIIFLYNSRFMLMDIPVVWVPLLFHIQGIQVSNLSMKIYLLLIYGLFNIIIMLEQYLKLDHDHFNHSNSLLNHPIIWHHTTWDIHNIRVTGNDALNITYGPIRAAETW